MITKITQAETYEEAIELVRADKTASSGAQMCHKIVKSAYGGYSVVAVEPKLFASMLAGRLPMLPQLKKGAFGDSDFAA